MNAWLRSVLTRITVVLTVGLCGGCVGSSSARLNELYADYNSAQYNAAFHRAETLAQSGNRKTAQEAAYIAGLSAYRMGNLPAAARYLRLASASSDEALAGDALGALGLVYAQQGDYALACNTFGRAAKKLTGEDRANAYYQAAVCSQKLGQWSQARSYLMLARSATSNSSLQSQISQALGTTGFTLQVGFFSVQSNAETEAQRLARKAADAKLGYPRIVPATDARGQAGYLVQVGQFSSYASAMTARDRFGEPLAMIVPLAR